MSETKNYTLRQAAELLGVKVSTLRVWIKTGYIKAKKYNDKKLWFISQEEIERIKGE